MVNLLPPNDFFASSFQITVLDTKKRIWGDVVQTNASKWREAGYPVPPTLISGARTWLFDLAEDLALRTGDECQSWFEGTGQVTNDRVARRVKEIMENTRLTLRLIGEIVELCGVSNFDVIQVCKPFPSLEKKNQMIFFYSYFNYCRGLWNLALFISSCRSRCSWGAR